MVPGIFLVSLWSPCKQDEPILKGGMKTLQATNWSCDTGHPAQIWHKIQAAIGNDHNFIIHLKMAAARPRCGLAKCSHITVRAPSLPILCCNGSAARVGVVSL